MKVARFAIALVSVSLMAGLALAQDSSQPPPGRGPGRGGFGGRGGAGSPLDRLTNAIGKLDLTAEQKEKLEALKKEYAPKVKALREKMESVRKEGQALFSEASPKFSDILTDDQKAKLKEAMAPRAGGRRGGRGPGQPHGDDNSDQTRGT